MPNPMIRIHNSQTNEIVDREMNAQEFAAYEADKAAQATRELELTAQANAKAAIAQKLGLSVDELTTLLA